jgi:hypothetical protein
MDQLIDKDAMTLHEGFSEGNRERVFLLTTQDPITVDLLEGQNCDSWIYTVFHRNLASRQTSRTVIRKNFERALIHLRTLLVWLECLDIGSPLGYRVNFAVRGHFVFSLFGRHPLVSLWHSKMVRTFAFFNRELIAFCRACLFMHCFSRYGRDSNRSLAMIESVYSYLMTKFVDHSRRTRQRMRDMEKQFSVVT